MNKLVKISLLAFSGLLLVSSPAWSDPPPQIKVEFYNTMLRTIKITSHDVRKVVVERVIVNNRNELDYCNITHMISLDGLTLSQGGTIPLTRAPLSTGDSVAVRADVRCMDPVIVDVFTNLGHVRVGFQ